MSSATTRRANRPEASSQVAADAHPPRYGVAGWPVAHSRSPKLHAAAYAALGIEAVYQRLPIPPELFEQTVTALPQSGFRGINVTLPHKQAALALAYTADSAASEIGAANTLTFDAAGIAAANTDAPALAAALADATAGQAAGTALVLGAGGTARAAVWALADAGYEVTIWNRTGRRGAELATAFGVDAIEALPDVLDRWQVVVNCTTLGMSPGDPSSTGAASLRGVGVAVEFVYGPQPTRFAALAREAGCRTIEGPELLARQGALSFAHWFGVDPPLATMREALG